MKLYYSPGACSQAPHILLHEIGLAHDAARVDLRSKTLEDGSSYLQINPKGAVPALALDNGEVLTENAVILQYLGDRAGSDVLPPVGDFRRYRVLEMVNFITTELHKSFAPLFKPNAGEERQRFHRDVDLPEPEGPMIAANCERSFTSPASSILSKAGSAADPSCSATR